MAQKRKAKEAFGGQVSAFAAARKARAQLAPEEAPEERLAAAIAGIPYDGPPDGDENALPEDRIPDRTSQSRLILQLSNLSRNLVQQIDNGLEIGLKSDQTVTFVGEYEIEVLSGVVSIYAAMLHPASGTHRVYALSSHALPPIVAKKPDTRIRITSVRSGTQTLEKYSPLFRGIGSGDDHSFFTLLRTSSDDPLHRTLSSLEVDEDTRKVLSRINARLEAREYAPRILSVGPKSTGKSTLNRLLSNMVVTRPGNDKCYYLDLDPGQPEFGPPGHISLVEVTAPLLGPSYTHLASNVSPQFRLIRAHTIAAMSFKDDPEHYVNCTIDLCRHIPRNVALVVNTCGWVTGLGASVLLDLVPHINPTDFVTLDSIDIALENGLRSSSTIHQIPRRQTKMFPSRTPAELRAMQAMAYFHHSYDLTGSSSWNDESISEMRPWMVSYEAEKPGIAAILSYGQAPHPDFLAEVLEGALVAIVVPDLINPEAVERTHKEDLPLIVDASSGCSPPLDPSQSRLIGLALVRGIDEIEKRIQLVTPLPETEVATLLENEVVLMRGGYDCPEWAYLEDLYLAESRGIEDEDFIDDRPWVSKRESHVGVEGAVWRLRHPPMKDAGK